MKNPSKCAFPAPHACSLLARTLRFSPAHTHTHTIPFRHAQGQHHALVGAALRVLRCVLPHG
jgi:hypothetical protein